MRDRFVHLTTQLLDEHDELVVVLADIGLSRFKATGALERHPSRIINVGIREQLQIGLAAGMAKESFRPIVHTYTPFLIERAFEQVKLDLGHQALGAILVSVGASYDATGEGRTHQAPEDVALMATLPGWEIAVPGHFAEAEAILRRACTETTRVYVRLAEDENTHAVADAHRRFVRVRDGADCAPIIVVIGPLLDRVLAATTDLDATVLYSARVQPFDRAGLRAAVKRMVTDVVLVEPCLEGTSSADVAAALSDVPHRMLALGVQRREHRRYGTRAQHDRDHGLDVAGIRSRIGAWRTLSVAGLL